MVEGATRVAWALIALLHVAPALPLFAPGLVERLYGVSSAGDAGVLLVHRGALFLAVFAAALFAIFSPESRRLASLVAAISMIGFLIVYWRAGMPAGDLRRIAIADLVGLAPLAFVLWRAWR